MQFNSPKDRNIATSDRLKATRDRLKEIRSRQQVAAAMLQSAAVDETSSLVTPALPHPVRSAGHFSPLTIPADKTVVTAQITSRMTHRPFPSIEKVLQDTTTLYWLMPQLRLFKCTAITVESSAVGDGAVKGSDGKIPSPDDVLFDVSNGEVHDERFREEQLEDDTMFIEDATGAETLMELRRGAN